MQQGNKKGVINCRKYVRLLQPVEKHESTDRLKIRCSGLRARRTSLKCQTQQE